MILVKWLYFPLCDSLVLLSPFRILNTAQNANPNKPAFFPALRARSTGRGLGLAAPPLGNETVPVFGEYGDDPQGPMLEAGIMEQKKN